MGQAALLVVGLGLLGGVIWWFGWDHVIEAFADVGWGMAWVSLYHFVPVATDTLGWRAFFPREHRPRLPRLFLYRWICESVNNMFPTGQVGGDVVRARLAAKSGTSTTASAAATVVDFTVGLLTQMAVALAALGLLAWKTGLNSTVGWILLAIVIFSGLISAFVAAQAWGLFGRVGEKMAALVRRITSHSMHGLEDTAERLDERISDIYHHRRAMVVGTLWRLASWSVGAVEIWLVTYFLDQPVAPGDAFILHGLSMTTRSIGFFIPAGLGVQEGGFILFGEMVGMSGPLALALGLVRRVREIILGVPGLLTWWSLEAHGIATKHTARESQ